MTVGVDHAERFWSKVHKTDGCWLWLGSRAHRDYGQFSAGGFAYRAHRVAFEWAHGPIPPGLAVCHRCDNPPCVNPAHLFLGTSADNNTDKTLKGRQAKGEGHGMARLTREQVIDIRRRCAAGEAQRSVARAYGATQAAISAIVRRRSWRALDDGFPAPLILDRGAHCRNKTHCPSGHPYSAENTRYYDGRRYCIECCRVKDARRRRAKAAA